MSTGNASTDDICTPGTLGKTLDALNFVPTLATAHRTIIHYLRKPLGDARDPTRI